jgi:alcohol dehydrogenase YqhD (iron-dependent ADH family)
MKNFIYHSPTKIVFGENQINQLDILLKENNVKRMLLVYGRESIKKLGIYEQIYKAVDTLGIEVFEESGVLPNPDVSSVRNGVKTCKDNNIDFILAAGGGSVADCAKAIGFGATLDVDVWDVYMHRTSAKESLPIGVIMTLAATGSETNGNSVISNREDNEKRNAAYHFSIPKFAIIDPNYNLSVNHHHTIAGSIDIIMHTLEQYFANTKDTSTSDYMMMGLMNSVIENTYKYLDGKNTYPVRANLSWASTIALNWILGVDKQGDWATHRLSYPITKEFQITHGYALAMIFTSWARTALKYNPNTMVPKLSLLGKELFNDDNYENTLDHLDQLFKSWGASVTISSVDGGVTENQIINLVENALIFGNVGNVIEVDLEVGKEIFKNSLNNKHEGE